MTVDDRALRALLAPRSIMIVGASDDRSKLSGRPVHYLKKYGYAGRILPVNANSDTVQDLRAHRSVAAVPQPIDMAVIAVPAEAAVSAVRECVRADAAVIVVFSAGFAELGRQGEKLQRALAQAAAPVRMLGPNCLGVINLQNGVTATFTSALDDLEVVPGSIALVSQSGAFGSMIFAAAQEALLGVNFVINTGNEADLTLAEAALAAIEDESVSVLLCYLEGVRDGARFVEMARRARELRKPVAVMKVGRTDVGARASSSHTAALAGEDSIYDAVFRKYGIHRAETMEELLDAGRMFASGRRLNGPNVTIVTISGGVGVLLADQCSEFGLSVKPWRGRWRGRLSELIPRFGSAANPVDVTATLIARPAILDEVLRLTVAHPHTDGVIVALGNSSVVERQLVHAIVSAYASTTKPMAVSWVGQSTGPLAQLAAAGVPAYPDASRAARAMAALLDTARDVGIVRSARRQPTRRRAALDLMATAGAESGVLDEHVSKQLLALYGIPQVPERVASTARDATEAAEALGYPVAVKLLSADLVHKTDVGGVQLDVRTATGVRTAARELLQIGADLGLPTPRLLVQSMIGDGLELIVGMRHDTTFGPAVLVGSGGVLAEFHADTVVSVPPLDLREADVMLSALRVGRAFAGVRGAAPLDRGAARRVIVATAELALELGDVVSEVEMNPLIVRSDGRGAAAIDAMVRLR